jgi:hypothetical protein
MVSEMSAELHKIAKTTVQKLKEDPGSVKEYPYKIWLQSWAS